LTGGTGSASWRRAVVDSEAAVWKFVVDVDETFAETDVFHGVVLLALDGSGHDKLE
jgi:hypothetical protein